MGLVSTVVVVSWNVNNKEWYVSKGYPFTKFKDKFEVKVEDLTKGSHVSILVECDGCDKPLHVLFQNYNKYKHEDGRYYCKDCAKQLIGEVKRMKTKLKNGKSFEQWCVENNRQDILNLWDNDLNKCKPSEVTFSSNVKRYFTCPRGIHSSELNNICDFTGGQEGSIRCRQCESLGQYIVDKFGQEFLLETWSDKNIKSSFEYTPYSNKITWWKCPNSKHDDFQRITQYSHQCDFRCPKCDYSKGEKRIELFLIENNLLYDPQKTFVGLFGINKGSLSYDFYLSDYNILIEYQGEYHDGKGSKNGFTKRNLKKQQEHDRRKKEYAEQNGIKLLEIWYWDFDNIEEIIKTKLNL